MSILEERGRVRPRINLLRVQLAVQVVVVVDAKQDAQDAEIIALDHVQQTVQDAQDAPAAKDLVYHVRAVQVALAHMRQRLVFLLV